MPSPTEQITLNRRHWFARTAGIGLLCIGSSFARTHSRSQDEIVVAIASPPGPFDPAIAPSVEQLIVVRPCRQTLLVRQVDANGLIRFEADLARDWKLSADGSRCTFSLDPRARFDDGSLVDAQAVHFTLRRLLALGRGPASLLRSLRAEVQVLDAHTVRIQLARPSPLFLIALSDKSTAIVNPRIPGASNDGDWGSLHLATHSEGSGPWRLQTGRSKGIWTLDRNPHWPVAWPASAPQRIQFREVRDPAVRLLALQKGDVDLALGIAIQDLPAAAKDPRLTVLSGPVAAFSNLAMNTASGTLRNLAIRRAIVHAIDTDAIANQLRDGLATRFPGPLPTGTQRAAQPLSYDMTAARALVSANASDISKRLDMIYPGLSQTTDTLAQYLQATLADAGLTVRLQRLTLPAFIDRIGRGTYDLALMGWVADSPDPASTLNVWFSNDRIGAGGNYARLSDEPLQRLIDASLTTADARERQQLIELAALRAQELQPYVYLFQTHNWLVHRKELSGVVFDGWDLFRFRPETWRRTEP
jgi:peptide/nickel transport system substrate-binding protein